MSLEKKNKRVFYCKKCNYTTTRKSNWEKHIITEKHKQDIILNPAKSIKCNTETTYNCNICGKEYRHKSSLSRHYRSCAEKIKHDVDHIESKDSKESKAEIVPLKEIETLRVKAELYDAQKTEIAELKDLVKKVAEKKPSTVHNWNVNILLETHCKNAMNIADFVKQLQLTQQDLFYTKQNGYIEGMSQVFIKGLKALTPAERPIHCVDKQQNLYIRDDGRWACDGDGRLLGTQISAVTKKHMDALKVWEKQHPDWHQSESQTKTYMELVKKTLGGSSDEEQERCRKLISKNIGKNTSFEDVVE